MLRRLLPPWIKRLRKKCPDCQVELHELGTTDFEPLRRGAPSDTTGIAPDTIGSVPDTTFTVTAPVNHAPSAKSRGRPKETPWKHR